MCRQLVLHARSLQVPDLNGPPPAVGADEEGGNWDDEEVRPVPIRSMPRGLKINICTAIESVPESLTIPFFLASQDFEPPPLSPEHGQAPKLSAGKAAKLEKEAKARRDADLALALEVRHFPLGLSDLPCGD